MKQDLKEVMVTLNKIYKERIQELPKHNMNQTNTTKEWVDKSETSINRIHKAENRMAFYFHADKRIID